MTLKLTLLENSKNYVYKSINEINYGIENNDILEFKYAIVHVFAGIELLMKKRLSNDHWSLLFHDVNKATITKFRTGNFKGPSIDDMINRLLYIVNIDERHLKRNELEQLKSIRNKIQHFGVDINSEFAKEMVAKGLKIFLNIYQNCFDEYDEDYVRSIITEVSTFEHFVNERLNELKNDLDKSSRPYHNLFKECPICHNECIIIDDMNNMFKYLFCQNNFDFDDIALTRAECLCDEICPQCGNQSLIFITRGNEVGSDICVYCDFYIDYDEDADWQSIKQRTYGKLY